LRLRESESGERESSAGAIMRACFEPIAMQALVITSSAVSSLQRPPAAA